MKREISCEGDRGKATRVASRFDAVCEITDDHFAGAKLRLVVDRDGHWTFYARTLGSTSLLRVCGGVIDKMGGVLITDE